MTNPNDKAYPIDPNQYASGLTKREWFAGMAMKALWDTVPGDQNVLVKPDNLAATACRMADALIKELSK